MEAFASTPTPPYYAVVFTSVLTGAETEAYSRMAETMERLAQSQEGYLGIESTRDSNGVGITVSYWKDLASIKAWRQNAEHRVAQRYGKEVWYSRFRVRICKVVDEYDELDSAQSSENEIVDG